MDAPGSDEANEQLREEVARLSSQVRRLTELVQALPAVDAKPVSAAPVGDLVAAPTPRRSFLRHGAAAAGALAAGAVAGGVLAAQPAAAANGNALIAGSGANQATAPTGIEVDGADRLKYGFGVTDNGLTPNLAYIPTIGGLPTSIWPGSPCPAVLGTAQLQRFDTGVFGYGDTTGTGVAGYSDHGFGVQGFSVNLTGVQAGSLNGPGATASSQNGHGAVVAGGKAAMKLGEASVAPPARADAHERHEVDAHEGSLWFCVAAGSPGSWRKVAGPDTAGSLHILAATARVYDSRAGAKPTTVVKGPLSAGTERTIDATLNGSGVPVGAVAVLVNLTVTNTNSGGYVAAFAANVAWPGNSSINWGAANTTVANTTVVGTDSQSRFKVRCPGGVTDLVIDVIGYYR